MKYFLYPYKRASGSARELSKVLKIKRLNSETIYYFKQPTTVINWGTSISTIDGMQLKWVNHPGAISLATNKDTCLNILKEKLIPVPLFTVEKEKVLKWLQDKQTVFARQKLRSHSGEGIVILNGNLSIDDIPNAPLYTLYIPKKREFRVHVMKGKVIDVQEKKRKKELLETVDYKIRSHENGWVFCREGYERIPVLEDLAIQTVETLKLDFGAVDIIYNEKHNKFFVLEVNTAPGLEGTSLEIYSNALRSIL